MSVRVYLKCNKSQCIKFIDKKKPYIKTIRFFRPPISLKAF